jgi:hypothetical protein
MKLLHEADYTNTTEAPINKMENVKDEKQFVYRQQSNEI